MKKSCFIALTMILTASFAFAWSDDEAKKLTEEAESKIIKIEDETEYREYIPYDVYNDAVINTMTSRTLLGEAEEVENDNEKEQLINEAYYNASIGIIKIDIALYKARAKKNRIDKLVHSGVPKDNKSTEEPDSNDSISANPAPVSGDKTALAGGIGAIFDAGLTKKDDTFRLELFDRDILIPDGTEFNRKGFDKIKKISTVLKSYPSSKIQVIGHTSNPDARGSSLAKARLFSQEIEKNGINKKRITSAGLGNNVVMETPVGYKRIDRIEIIITGIR